MLPIQIHPPMCGEQVREQLWTPYWAQWIADTGTLLQKLPSSLATTEQASPLLLTFERWLLELKASPWVYCMLPQDP